MDKNSCPRCGNNQGIPAEGLPGYTQCIVCGITNKDADWNRRNCGSTALKSAVVALACVLGVAGCDERSPAAISTRAEAILAKNLKATEIHTIWLSNNTYIATYRAPSGDVCKFILPHPRTNINSEDERVIRTGSVVIIHPAQPRNIMLDLLPPVESITPEILVPEVEEPEEQN